MEVSAFLAKQGDFRCLQRRQQSEATCRSVPKIADTGNSQPTNPQETWEFYHRLRAVRLRNFGVKKRTIAKRCVLGKIASLPLRHASTPLAVSCSSDCVAVKHKQSTIADRSYLCPLKTALLNLLTSMLRMSVAG